MASWYDEDKNKEYAGMADPYKYTVAPASTKRSIPSKPETGISKPVFQGPVKKSTTGTVATESSADDRETGSTTTGTSTTKSIYDKPLPSTPEAQEFKAPEYDEREVDKMTQQQAASGIRSLRTTVQQAISGGGSNMNPNVKRMTLRDALAGYGQGLESVMGGASSRATSIYGQRHATDIMESQLNFQAKQRADELDFNKLMEEYRGSKVTTTTSDQDVERKFGDQVSGDSTSSPYAAKKDQFGNEFDILGRRINPFGTEN